MGDVPVGSGLPAWLDTEKFLSADETRDLGESIVLSARHIYTGKCLICDAAPATDKAHVARKQMGGRPNGAGPVLPLCRACHDDLDTTEAWCVAVERPEAGRSLTDVDVVFADGGRVRVGYVGLRP